MSWQQGRQNGNKGAAKLSGILGTQARTTFNVQHSSTEIAKQHSMFLTTVGPARSMRAKMLGAPRPHVRAGYRLLFLELGGGHLCFRIFSFGPVFLKS